jgi:hypothetical protein
VLAYSSVSSCRHIPTAPEPADVLELEGREGAMDYVRLIDP